MQEHAKTIAILVLQKGALHSLTSHCSIYTSDSFVIKRFLTTRNTILTYTTPPLGMMLGVLTHTEPQPKRRQFVNINV